MRGRHRRSGSLTVTPFQMWIMILFGSLGVIMVIASQLLTRPTGRRRTS
jgi:hypothetical protein